MSAMFESNMIRVRFFKDPRIEIVTCVNGYGIDPYKVLIFILFFAF